MERMRLRWLQFGQKKMENNIMRSENIEVTFKIPIPVDKPDLNGVIYSKKAIRNAYKNVKDIPIEIPCNDGQFLPIGVAQEIELIEEFESQFSIKMKIE